MTGAPVITQHANLCPGREARDTGKIHQVALRLQVLREKNAHRLKLDYMFTKKLPTTLTIFLFYCTHPAHKPQKNNRWKKDYSSITRFGNRNCLFFLCM